MLYRIELGFVVDIVDRTTRCVSNHLTPVEAAFAAFAVEYETALHQLARITYLLLDQEWCQFEGFDSSCFESCYSESSWAPPCLLVDLRWVG